MNLKFKFSLFVVLLVTTVLTISTAFFLVIRARAITTELGEQDQLASVIVAEDLSNNFADYYFYQYDTYREFVRTHLNTYAPILHFTMFSTNGEVLFDTDALADPAGAPPRKYEKNQNSEVLRVIADKKPHIDTVQWHNQSVIRIFAPYIDKFGIYRNLFEFEFSNEELNMAIRNTIIYYSIALVIFIGISLGLTLLLVKQILKPIERLTRAAEEFSKGNFEYHIDITASDEIGTLSRTFSKMAQDLMNSRGNLEEQNKRLEKEVKIRTQEIRQQLEEMERLQKITIDRELKMIEMKKQVEILSTPITSK